MERQKIAGMSLGGGRKENFYFCLIEYFSDQDRWFLKSVHQVKEEPINDGDRAIREWISKYGLQKLVVDFPLTSPACHTCRLDCPGMHNCPVENVKKVKQMATELLEEDQKLVASNPKAYERSRNENDEIRFGEGFFENPTSSHLLSRSFKRRLKKGFLPYWNRPLDYWIWGQYYDPLLKTFDISFDSFGNSSQMLQFRMEYLKKHFPMDLELYEGYGPICLLELYRSKIISRQQLLNLKDFTLGAESRLDIIRSIEKELKIFIYDRDLELIVKDPRAFSSFVLAIVGQRFLMKKTKILPSWTNPKETRFQVPSFASADL